MKIAIWENLLGGVFLAIISSSAPLIPEEEHQFFKIYEPVMSGRIIASFPPEKREALYMSQRT
jgi:hypothetical protein